MVDDFYNALVICSKLLVELNQVMSFPDVSCGIPYYVTIICLVRSHAFIEEFDIIVIIKNSFQALFSFLLFILHYGL